MHKYSEETLSMIMECSERLNGKCFDYAGMSGVKMDEKLAVIDSILTDAVDIGNYIDSREYHIALNKLFLYWKAATRPPAEFIYDKQEIFELLAEIIYGSDKAHEWADNVEVLR